MPSSQAGNQHLPESEPLSTATTEWCQGFALAESRRLSPAEIESLSQEAKLLRRHGCMAGCLSPVFFFVALICLIPINDKFIDKQPFNVVTGLAMAAIFAVVGLPLLSASDNLKRAKGMKLDVEAGYVKRFAGEIEVPADSAEFAANSGTASENLESTQPPPTRLEPIEFEVLPCSHRVWRVKGEPVQKWEEASWSEVAQTPQIARMAATWVEPLQSAPLPTLDSQQHGQRDLSNAEKDELQRRARRAWLRPFWPALLLSLWSAVPITVMFLDPHARGSESGAYSYSPLQHSPVLRFFMAS